MFIFLPCKVKLLFLTQYKCQKWKDTNTQPCINIYTFIYYTCININVFLLYVCTYL